MWNARVISGTVAVVLGSGLVIYAAQQSTPVRISPSIFAGLHDGCAPAGGHGTDTTGTSHLPPHLTQALDLTTAQLADIDRMSAELCQAINKTHEGIMNVLTPEQRVRVAELHGAGHGGDHHAGGLHAFFRKLHGGGK